MISRVCRDFKRYLEILETLCSWHASPHYQRELKRNVWDWKYSDKACDRGNLTKKTAESKHRERNTYGATLPSRSHKPWKLTRVMILASALDLTHSIISAVSALLNEIPSQQSHLFEGFRPWAYQCISLIRFLEDWPKAPQMQKVSSRHGFFELVYPLILAGNILQSYADSRSLWKRVDIAEAKYFRGLVIQDWGQRASRPSPWYRRSCAHRSGGFDRHKRPMMFNLN